VLVDCGQYSSAVLRAAEMGKNEGSGRIDALVLTRLYRRHSKTVLQLLEEYYVESLWIPAGISGDDIAIEESLRQIAVDMGCPVYTYLPGEILTVGDAAFQAPEFYRNGSSAENVSFSVSVGGKTLSYSTDGSLGGDVTVAGGRCTDAILSGNTVVSEKGGVTCAVLGSDAVISDEIRVKISLDGDTSIADISTFP